MKTWSGRREETRIEPATDSLEVRQPFDPIPVSRFSSGYQDSLKSTQLPLFSTLPPLCVVLSYANFPGFGDVFCQTATTREPIMKIQHTPIIHLYWDAPCVRTWSIYKSTVKLWSLCGIYNKHSRAKDALQATEDPRKMNCPQCVRLMHPEACRLAKAPCGLCEADAERMRMNSKGKRAA